MENWTIKWELRCKHCHHVIKKILQARSEKSDEIAIVKERLYHEGKHCLKYGVA